MIEKVNAIFNSNKKKMLYYIFDWLEQFDLPGAECLVILHSEL